MEAYGATSPGADGLFDLSRFEGDCVLFFDLEPVLRRASSRWLLERDHLKIICERQVRAVAPHDMIVFSRTGFYLIASSGSEADARIRASQINLRLLQLFFGSDSLAPDQVVTMYRAATSEEVRQASPTFKFPAREQPAAVELANPVSTGIQFVFSPVEDFRSGRTSALFCVPYRRTALELLYGYNRLSQSGQDTLDLDLLSLDQAVSFTQRLAHNGLYTAVGASVGFETLARPRWREAYQRKLQETNALDNPLLILKIDAVPIGVTSTRLAHLVHAIRPYAKRIFVHLPERTLPLSQTGFLGASGFVFSLTRRLTPTQVSEETGRLIEFCAGQGALSSIDNIQTPAQRDLVRTVGARFGAVMPTELSSLQADSHIASLTREAAAMPSAS